MDIRSFLSKKDPAFIGAAAIMLAAFLWAVDGVLLRPSLYSLDVAIVVFLEHFLAFVYMAPFLLRHKKELLSFGPSQWAAFFWIALFGGAIGTMAITQALFLVNFVPLSVPILLQKLQPVFAILLATVLLKERPSKKFYAFALTALIGSYFVTFGFDSPVLSLDNKTFVAALLGLLAAFSWGSSTTVGRYALNKVGVMLTTYLRFGLTALMMLSFILATGKLAAFGAVGQNQLLTLLVIVFSSGGVAMMIYYYGLKSVPASKATLYELVFPLSAIVLDFVLHGKLLSFGQFTGAVLLMYSMVMISRIKIAARQPA